jgi:hypothetical protein
MYEYSSSHTLQSEVFPGVTFTLRKMSDSRRAELRLKTAKSNATVRELVKESQKVMAQPEESRDLARIAEIHEMIETEVISVLNPTWLRWGLKSVSGMTIDGQEPNVELLLAEGPSDLVAEILVTIKRVSHMSEDELKNFVLPSTFGAVEDGSERNTTAEPANDAAFSEAETAPSTSQS